MPGLRAMVFITPEDVLERNRRWREANKEKVREQARASRARNKEQRRQYNLKWRHENPEAARRHSRDCDNKPETRQQRKEYGKLFAAEHRARTAAYRARKKSAAPPWLTKDQLSQMAEKYREARLLGMQVDHIVPLNGEFVCGLHVPWNLQLLTPEENMAKGNSWGEKWQT
jgi:hypothetical protein